VDAIRPRRLTARRRHVRTSWRWWQYGRCAVRCSGLPRVRSRVRRVSQDLCVRTSHMLLEKWPNDRRCCLSMSRSTFDPAGCRARLDADARDEKMGLPPLPRL
jgi:hypothetical protein